jgi:hypothetical protein
MNQSQRGFHFLVGLSVLWLLWQLKSKGLILQAAMMATGGIYYGGADEAVYGGPGAVIVAFVIEAIVAIGLVVTLLASGIWDALYTMGAFISDGFKSANGYLAVFQKPKASPLPGDASGTDAAPASDVGKTPEMLAIEQISRDVSKVSEVVIGLAQRVDAVEGKNGTD